MSTLSGVSILFILSLAYAQHRYHAVGPQRYFNYHVNPYVSAQVKGGDSDEGSISLTFLGNVHKKDNFKISTKYVNAEGATVSHVVKVTNLCDQLDMELQGDQPLKLSDLLGLSGIQCPILVSDTDEKFEAKPMKWHSQHRFPEEIECGVHSYHATLYKCDNGGNNCNVLLETGIKSLPPSRHCGEAEELGEPSALPIDLSSDIKVSQVSKTRLTDANTKNFEIIDTSSNGETVGTIQTADVTAQQVDEINLVDGRTGQKYDILNSEVNNVRVVDTKITNHNQNDLNGNFDDDEDDDDDDDDDEDEDDDDDDDNYEYDNIYDPEPPQTRVSQVKTKGSSVTHLEKIEDQLGDSEILESQDERDQTVDFESDNVAIETHNGNQNEKFSSNLGSIIMGNKMKSNTVLHSF